MHHNFDGQGMFISPRTVKRRIMKMAADVTGQLIVALKAADIFSVALDESININDNSYLAIVVKYCSNG